MQGWAGGAHRCGGKRKPAGVFFGAGSLKLCRRRNVSHVIRIMKTFLSLGLAVLALVPARAQIFRPEAVNGALLGGIAGAVMGNNSGSLGHNAWKGAAIGAGAGLLIGAAVGDANDGRTRVAPAPRDLYVLRQSAAPVVYGGYSSGRHGHVYDRGYARYGYERNYGYDGFGYGGYYGGGYGSGSGAAQGVLLGGLAGGIIGHNSGEFRHNGWRGAAWGAGIGWLLGSIADGYRQPVIYDSPPVVYHPAPAAQPPAAPAPPVTIINNYYNAPATPMSSANGLFGRE
jgi:YMGG-like Gly-zipper